jgi:hypothetical protein
MNIVIDTNVFISSFFGGSPRKIIDLWKNGTVVLCLSDKIIDEYIKVLLRFCFKAEKEIAEILSLFASGYNLLFTGKKLNLKIVKDDPDDDKFIECAVAWNAKYIIRGDHALLNVKEYRGIRIVTPTTFLMEYYKNR